MDEEKYKKLAYAVAEDAPRHLDKPTSPPLNWWVDGDRLGVILADGRKISVLISQVKEIKPAKSTVKTIVLDEKEPKPAPTPVMGLPTRTTPAPHSGEVSVRKADQSAYKPPPRK
jgi:hypothetical protein